MTIFADVRTRNAGNIFKGLDGLVAVAPMSVPALTKAALFTVASAGPPAVIGGQIKALPAGWRQLGWCSTDGIGKSRDVTVSDTPAWGAAEPIVRTVSAVSKTLTVGPMESNKTVDELYYMANLAGVVADANGVINWQEPALPVLREWRVIAIAKYDARAGEWYKIDQFVRATVQSNGDENWTTDDGGNVHPLVATAQVDDALGYAVEHFQGGPGFPAAAAGYGA